MEGLIPYVIRVVKKSRALNGYMSLSESSVHPSYHLLGRAETLEGSSSHRRIRPEFPPPPVEFLENRPGNEFLRQRNVNKGPVKPTSSVGGGFNMVQILSSWERHKLLIFLVFEDEDIEKEEWSEFLSVRFIYLLIGWFPARLCSCNCKKVPSVVHFVSNKNKIIPTNKLYKLIYT